MILFLGRDLRFSHPYEEPILKKSTLSHVLIFFATQYPKKYRIALAVDLFRLNTIKGTKTALNSCVLGTTNRSVLFM